MRVLVVSDIHANLDALQTVLDAAPAYDLLWNLGDVVGYGADPNEVISIAQGLGEIFVRGNHDKACCGISDASDFNLIAAQAAFWTRETLSNENFEWLRTLPPGPIKPNPSEDISCVHGSPLDEDEYLIDMRDAVHALNLWQPRITFFGHTHVQGAFALNGKQSEGVRPRYELPNVPQRFHFDLRPNYRYLINPGSVGQPRDGDPRSAFALYDSDEERITFYRVPYNIAAQQKKILDAGLAQRLATRLAEGR